jgi:hypothetical protein
VDGYSDFACCGFIRKGSTRINVWLSQSGTTAKADGGGALVMKDQTGPERRQEETLAAVNPERENISNLQTTGAYSSREHF